MFMRYVAVALLASILSVMLTVFLFPYVQERAAAAKDRADIQQFIDEAAKRGY
jgi:hypothetical protein